MGFDFLKRDKKPKSEAEKPATSDVPVASRNADEPIRVYNMGPSQEMRYTVELLAGKGLEFEEIDVTANAAMQSWVKQRTHSNEYPQVFLGREPLGDFGALRELDLQGNLDRILAGLPPLGTDDGEDDLVGDGLEVVRARLRRGDILSLTTGEGETFDTWAEVYANPPQVYYRGEPRPIADMDEIVREIMELLGDEATQSEWSAGDD